MRFVRAALLFVGLLSLCACAVPLGPGFRIEQEQLEVRYAGGSPARLHVRAIFDLRNIGNRELTALDADIPDEKGFGRQNLQAWVNDREVSLQSAANPGAGTARILFNPPWLQKRGLRLIYEYDLIPPLGGFEGAAANEVSFHLRDAAAFPDLRPPKVFLAKGGERPKEIRFLVHAPSDFVVLAPGREQSPRRQGNDLEHRYRLPEKDFQTFVVGGRFHEERISTPDGVVIFWTFAPLPSGQAQAAATRLAATFALFVKMFGPVEKRPPPVHVIETSARLSDRSAGVGEIGGVALPAAALLDHGAFAMGATSDAFLDLAEHELAHTWFGWVVAPKPEAALLLGEGICDYALVAAADLRSGAEERRRRVVELLRRYDDARAKFGEKPLLAPREDFSAAQREVASFKAPLFYVALEDQYGKENVQRALAHVIRAMRFGRIADEELRSALEQETHQDLADFFRIWLNQKDIRASFRSRYLGAGESKQ